MKLDLRPLKPSDQSVFLAATRRSRRLHRPWVRPPTRPQEFAEFADPGPRRVRLLLWGRERRRRGTPASEELLGYFALNEIVQGGFKNAYLGYWGVEPHSGRGHMSGGMQLLLRYAFGRLRLHRVEANIQPENRPSLALARTAGFRKEGFSPRYLKVAGRWRDHERWAMTVEDWRGL